MSGDEPVDEEGFRLRGAALLRSAANDLKRDDAAAAADLGVSVADFAAYAEGRRAVPGELVRRAAAVWPVNEADLLPWRDDCPDGVVIHRLADSIASARVLTRGGIDYYEYRDTAMSRVASFRPEWIKMLSVVDDDDPAHPGVRWNKGHLLYQFTYFVGPVNYYVREPEGDRVLRMDTGDSVWGVPYSPHTFTSRSAGEEAYILALTYGGELVGDAQRELAALGAETAANFARAPGGLTFPAILQDFLNALALPADRLAALSGLSEERVADLLDGAVAPAPEEITRLAVALRVSPRDLMPIKRDVVGSIRHCRAGEAREWRYPSSPQAAYRIRELAGSSLHPHTRALEIIPLAAADRVAPSSSSLRTYQHQYVYNVSSQTADLAWRFEGRSFRDRLDPGDSAYLKPFVEVAFASERPDACRLLSLRIGGRVTPETRTALGTIYPGSLPRYLRENGRWY
ncbi:XRE family transcriptional regulator [Nonomuraea turkmeniaca]|uniref:XRE family transcriptional regulator n=1 Tax=Nonomuraea turkmeniaca TaxID=103838 RepID=A0A5S4FY94_9ACTN|nr:XRE family transcriptional regulator [Nonomuraea turkmeniaca]TMR25659.1 XRE family transcriptional regulator [Nonomuraea turkmeniaca]